VEGPLVGGKLCEETSGELNDEAVRWKGFLCELIEYDLLPEKRAWGDFNEKNESEPELLVWFATRDSFR
jgi:hypothetical protein